MIFHERESGLFVAGSAPAPPEHPARQAIRRALQTLAEELRGCEQTTHGRLGPFTIETLARDLVECYNDPRAYTVADLYMAIKGLNE